MANIGPHEDIPVESKKSLNPMGTVYMDGEFKNIIWLKKSSQVQRKVNNMVVIIAGIVRGKMIFV